MNKKNNYILSRIAYISGGYCLALLVSYVVSEKPVAHESTPIDVPQILVSTDEEKEIIPIPEESSTIPQSHLSKAVDAFFQLDASALKDHYEQLKDASNETKSLMLPGLFAAWAEKAPEQALLAAKGLAGQKDEAIAIVLASWAEKDPVAASNFYQLHSADLFNRNYIDPWNQVSGSGIIATRLAKVDTHQALSWTLQLPDIADRNYAISTLFKEITKHSPEQALVFLEASDLDGGSLRSAMTAITTAWASEDLESAIDWVNGLDDETQPNVIPYIVAGIAKEDPHLAGEYLEFIDGNRDEAIGQIVTPWVQKEPEETMNWLVTSTTQEEQQSFLKPLMQRWIDQDIYAAKDWVLNHQKGPLRDMAIEAYVASTVNGHEDHYDLINIANNEIESLEHRERAVVDALVSWARLDEVAANHYAEESLELTDTSLSNYYYRINARDPLD